MSAEPRFPPEQVEAFRAVRILGVRAGAEPERMATTLALVPA